MVQGKVPTSVLNVAIPAPFVKKTVLFSLNGLNTLVKNQLILGMRVISGFSSLFH